MTLTDTTRTPTPHGMRCGCTNHLGFPKKPHPSRSAALAWILDHLQHAVSLSYYRCPRRPGVWHVRSERV